MTLLNTWHAWKFHSEETRSRSKVEYRNRARMEAIAYWMHCLPDEEGKTQRAVIPYTNLRDFLTQSITEIEKPLRDDASVLAEVFLRFVKERAGLLIEVGDGLYSFVHLTFQAYLTATHLRKSGETGGVGVIWTCIADRCGDGRCCLHHALPRRCRLSACLARYEQWHHGKHAETDGVCPSRDRVAVGQGLSDREPLQPEHDGELQEQDQAKRQATDPQPRREGGGHGKAPHHPARGDKDHA